MPGTEPELLRPRRIDSDHAKCARTRIWRTRPSPTVSVPTRLAAVLEAAVDAPARPVGAAVPDPAACGVYPLIILIVYVIVTGGIL